MPPKQKADTAGYQQLKKDLAGGEPGRLYLFHGEETYLRDHYLGRLKELLLTGGMGEFNLHTIPAREMSPRRLEEAVDCLPMMAPRTLVLVRDFDLFKAGEITGARLASIHNLRFLIRLMEQVKQAIQEDRLLEQLTAAENVRFVCGGLPVETETLLLRLGLEKESLSRSVREFSGGMKRRVAIARALLADFDILFLDEPTLGLDVLARSDLWDTIRALKGRMTIVLTTHYMEEAEELSDRVGVMRDGHLLALGTPAELKAQAGKEKFEDAFVAIVRGKAQ